jgi:hypothetical protein
MLSATTCLAKRRTAMSLEEDEDSGEQFNSIMSRMIEKQKEAIARARDPGLNPDERRKAAQAGLP